MVARKCWYLRWTNSDHIIYSTVHALRSWLFRTYGNPLLHFQRGSFSFTARQKPSDPSSDIYSYILLGANLSTTFERFCSSSTLCDNNWPHNCAIHIFLICCGEYCQVGSNLVYQNRRYQIWIHENIWAFTRRTHDI